jgi:hypothetical protein
MVVAFDMDHASEKVEWYERSDLGCRDVDVGGSFSVVDRAPRIWGLRRCPAAVRGEDPPDISCLI